jgi:microsomal epoxide hydrolase
MSLARKFTFAIAVLWEVSSLAQPAAIQYRYFTTSDNVRLHYLEAGRATSAPALVLIPGFTITASLWKQQLELFSDKRLVIAVDPRSQGESSISLSGNTPEQRAVDLHELLAGLHISKTVLVGWSQGAQDVAAYIQRYGAGSLAGVVFVDSAVSYGAAEVELHKEFSMSVLSRLNMYAAYPNDYSEAMIRSMFVKSHPDLDIKHVIEEAKKTPPSIGISMLVMDLFGVDRRPALKEIDCPALVMASAGSPLLEAQREMAASIRGARFVEIEDTGHAIFVDQPERFNSALAELLEKADRFSPATAALWTRAGSLL